MNGIIFKMVGRLKNPILAFCRNDITQTCLGECG